MNKNIKILVIVLVIGALAAIYFNKNLSDSSGNTQTDKPEINATQTEESYETTTNEYYDLAIENGYPTFLEFTTSTCPACKYMEPTIEEAKIKFKGKANVVVVNLDLQENAHLAMAYNVRVVPTLVFLDNDAVIKSRTEGVTTLDDIEKMLKEAGMK